MSRFAFVLLVLAACPKKEKAADSEPVGSGSGAPPARGYSVTKVEDPNAGSGSGEGSAGRLAAALNRVAGSGDQPAPAGSGDVPTPTPTPTPTPAAGPVDAGGAAEPAKPDAMLYGGNGSPAYIDDEGHLQGPGGFVSRGRGPMCDDKQNHCLREPAWFAVGNLVAGKLYRAVPIFEYEKKWYNWRGKEEDFAMRLLTKVGTKAKLKPGDPVIWLIDENASKKFIDIEHDALTSSRWEAGVIESVGTDSIRVKGWTYGTVPIDTTRIVVDTKTK